MVYKLFLYSFFAVIASHSVAATICEYSGFDECQYTITCKYHAGSASNPICSAEPNVTFIITLSTLDRLTPSFFGATNFDSRVRTIKAINNSWKSIEKRAFSYYTKTVKLELSGNNIHYVRDEAFSAMLAVTYMDLSNNVIDDLFPYSFLISDSHQSKVQYLDLSYNQLTSFVDDVFTPLTNLVELYLKGNKLKVLADNCFGNLKFLTTLDLQHNDLESLNMTLINLKSLKFLDLSFNEFQRIVGYETNRLKSLENINISHNAIESFDKDCFVQSTELKIADMSYNLISCKIENMMFASNTKLTYLNLFHNRITSIEENSFKYNNILKELNLENNTISADIKTSTFSGLVNISKLDLSRQNITTLRERAFYEMRSLTFLNLSRNSINLIENFAFYNSSIYILDLSRNNITQLNFLNGSLENTIELYLQNNNIQFIYNNSFTSQKMLTKLDLSINKIVRIEQNALPLTKLQYLNLTSNFLTGNISANVFSPAPNLRYLDLNNFNISRIERFAFNDMPVVARLNLSHNAIEYIDKVNFFDMGNMYSIDISFNKLKEIYFSENVTKNLKSAYLNNNNLSNISGIFSTPTKLLYLDISDNGLMDISCISFKIFPELQVLHLANNNIVNFNNPNVNSLNNLVDLNLSSNQIRNVDLSYFKDLMMVDLNNNSIQFINNTFFKNIDFLHYLDLSQNLITDIPPGTFQNMKNLKLLNLSRNSILTLRYGSLKGLHKTELLDLSYNNIENLDVYVFHECVELTSLIIDYNKIKTLDIDRLILLTDNKLRTLSLGGNPISCQEILRNVTLRNMHPYSGLQVEITSIHKIYHEDNVHGIRCGDNILTTTVKTEIKPNNGDSSTNILVFCVLTLVIIILVYFVIYFVKRFLRRRDGVVIYRDSRAQLRNSLELSTSDYAMVG